MTEEQSLTIIKLFDAPIEKVWKAWTTPDGWNEWYGKPWDVPKEETAMDVRVGGRWKSTTIAEGHTIHFTGEYKEVNEPHKLVMTIEDPENPQNPNVELVTVVLKEVDGKSEMNFKQAGNLPPQEYQTGLKEGWGGFFAALETYLAQA